ncbi:MAG: flagellar biosynthesis protein FlhB [Planctomycetota bacterium]|nr:MAG: flagellar biosynthesis protein FlhB [Planctomycetota bacterium]
MAEDDSQEDRTEEPSERKRQQAREKGQIPRSADFAGAAVLCAGVTILFIFGETMMEGLKDITIYFIRMTGDTPDFITIEDVRNLTITTFIILFKSSWFFWVALIIAAIVSNLIMVGFYMSGEPLKPKFEKLNVFKGIKQKFSFSTLNLLVQNLAKFFLISTVVYLIIKSLWAESLNSANIGFLVMTDLMITGVFRIAMLSAFTLLAWSILDLIYQKWNHTRQIRMTKEEVKKEMKDMVGDPYIRQRRRQIQLNLARQRMMTQVPEADVIVTNPIYIAIAIKYDADTMAAPIVLAKGKRKTAEKIRNIAREHSIPIVEKKELAREIYKLCDAGDPIPESLFVAVAEILAYIYQLSKKKRA